MANIILRDNGSEFFNLQEFSNFVVTNTVELRGTPSNPVGTTVTITVPNVPAGATPYIQILDQMHFLNAERSASIAFEVVMPNIIKYTVYEGFTNYLNADVGYY